jgi:hypothetical protein
MSQVIDPRLIPMIDGNHRPQFNPALQIFVPLFMQAVHDFSTVADPLPGDVVEQAWATAVHAFARLGLQYEPPLGCKPIEQP